MLWMSQFYFDFSLTGALLCRSNKMRHSLLCIYKVKIWKQLKYFQQLHLAATLCHRTVHRQTYLKAMAFIILSHIYSSFTILTFKYCNIVVIWPEHISPPSLRGTTVNNPDRSEMTHWKWHLFNTKHFLYSFISTKPQRGSSTSHRSKQNGSVSKPWLKYEVNWWGKQFSLLDQTKMHWNSIENSD